MLEKVMELAGPDAFSVRELVRLVCETRGLRRPMLPVPMGVSRRFLAALQALGLHIPITSYHLEMLAVAPSPEPGALETFLGASPGHLPDGIGYIQEVTRWDAWKGLLSGMPYHIRDH